jgi:hypothetical protein
VTLASLIPFPPTIAFFGALSEYIGELQAALFDPLREVFGKIKSTLADVKRSVVPLLNGVESARRTHANLFVISDVLLKDSLTAMKCRQEARYVFVGLSSPNNPFRSIGTSVNQITNSFTVFPATELIKAISDRLERFIGKNVLCKLVKQVQDVQEGWDKTVGVILGPVSDLLNQVIEVTLPIPKLIQRMVCIPVPDGIEYCSKRVFGSKVSYPCGIHYRDACTLVWIPEIVWEKLRFKIRDLLHPLQTANRIFKDIIKEAISNVFRALHLPDLGQLLLNAIPAMEPVRAFIGEDYSTIAENLVEDQFVKLLPSDFKPIWDLATLGSRMDVEFVVRRIPLFRPVMDLLDGRLPWGLIKCSPTKSPTKDPTFSPTPATTLVPTISANSTSSPNSNGQGRLLATIAATTALDFQVHKTQSLTIPPVLLNEIILGLQIFKTLIPESSLPPLTLKKGSTGCYDHPNFNEGNGITLSSDVVLGRGFFLLLRYHPFPKELNTDGVLVQSAKLASSMICFPNKKGLATNPIGAFPRIGATAINSNLVDATNAAESFRVTMLQ